MKAKAIAIAALGLGALAAPASAQIIATSIPREVAAGAAEKRWTLHLMGSPYAKWRYGEVYCCFIGDLLALGVVESRPTSDFLLAGEVAFKLGENWSAGVGGWYNKVGTSTFDFAGDGLLDLDVIGITADLDGDLKIYEGHFGIFYKDVGIQAGVVRTNGTIGTNVRLKTLDFPGLGTVDCRSAEFRDICGGAIGIETFNADTTDWDLFGVYKHTWGGSTPFGLSLGAGVYRKQGIESGSPLRSPEDQTVFSAFATGSLDVYRGLGIDASFWYVGQTGEVENFLGQQERSRRGDSQSRFTIGLSYSISR